VLNVVVVGATDRQLEELVRAAGVKTTVINENGFVGLTAPGATQPDVVVLDVRGKNTLPPAVATLRRQHPGTGVIIVASSLDPSLLLEAMRASVNEVLAEPLAQTDLEDAFSRVIGQRRPTEVGQVFGFVGAKGGVGTTTVAVNVATSLASIAKGDRTLLVDLHQAGGDAAVFLGVEPRFSVADALDNAHRLDQTFFRGLVTHPVKDLDLLPAPERAVAAHLDAAKVRKLIDVVSGMYKYIVIDLPRSDGPILDALDHVNSVIVVANQELATVKSAGRLAATLRQRYGREKVSLVLSRSDRQADIGQTDVERAVGCEIAFIFPSDYRIALQALNKGRPLALDNHNELSSSFKRFALQLAGRPDRGPEPPSGSGLFGRLRRR